MKTIDTVPPVTDSVNQEVRRYMQAIAEEFGFDVLALGRSLDRDGSLKCGMIAG